MQGDFDDSPPIPQLDHRTDVTESFLEPPGSIGILGGTLLGLEAALYGRFLGYDVTLLADSSPAAPWLAAGDRPLACLPGRILSPLGLEALAAQSPRNTTPPSLPLTCGDWGHQIVDPLSRVDLLAGRVHADQKVTSVGRLPATQDPTELDFFVHVAGVPDPWTFEALIDATGILGEVADQATLPEATDPAAEIDYCFALPHPGIDAGEAAWQSGRQAIVALFAELADRAGLDLYRPRRL